MKKINRQSMFEYIVSNILDYINSLFNIDNKIAIPKKIDTYTVVRSLSLESMSDTAVLLCKDKNNKKVVVKVWQGKYKNTSHFGLLNEYNAYKILWSTINKIGKNMPSIFKDIKLPRLIDYIENKGQTVLVIEWIDGGNNLEKYSDAKIVKTYKKILKYFDYISSRISDRDKQNLNIINPIYYVLTYPFYVLIAAVLNFNFIKIIISGVTIFMRGLNNIIEDNKLVFVHRDLNFKNIIVKGGVSYIIDFQYAVFTIKVVEYVNTLRYSWDKDIIKDSLIEMAKIANNKMQLKSLIVAHGTHGLTARNFNKKTISNIVAYIRKGIELN